MLIAKAVSAVVLAAGLAAALLVMTGDKASSEQVAGLDRPFVVVEAVGWDGGPGAPIDR